MNENARARVFAAGSKGKDEKVRERRCGGASGEGCFPFTGTPGYRRDFFRLIARHPPPSLSPYGYSLRAGTCNYGGEARRGGAHASGKGGGGWSDPG